MIPPRPTEPLTDVAATGDRLATLEALRARLAAGIDACDSMRDLATMTATMQKLLAEIETLSSGKARSSVDDLKSRRDQRRATPAAS